MAACATGNEITKERRCGRTVGSNRTLKFCGGAERRLLAAFARCAGCGRQVIGPRFCGLFCCAIFGIDEVRGAIGFALPVDGRVGDAPDIAVIVERDAYEEMVAACTERQATGDAAGSGCARRKIGEKDRGFQRQRLRTAKAAALSADHQCHARRGEWQTTIHAGDGHGNLDAQPGAAASGFWSKDFHTGEI
jgi:hypothetical protein